MSASTFKMFKGGKSKARKGLARAYPEAVAFADDVLQAVEGEWGFYPNEVEALLATPASDTGAQTVSESAADTSTVENEPGEAEAEDEELDVNPAPAPNMFAGIAGTILATPTKAAAQTQKAASRSSYTIEKDRVEQNGIKRPSVGGLCRAVWDGMDHIRETTGAVPVSSQVRELAAREEWNPNNAMIEFYQWRKFNGITGRAPKAAPAAPAAPAATE